MSYREYQNTSSYGTNTDFRKFHIDGPLFFLLCLCCGFGLFVLYSASGQSAAMVERQLVRMLIAFIGMLVIAQIKPAKLSSWAPWLYTGGIVLLLAVLFMGVGAKGAQRWLALPFIGVRFQPSEIMKLIVPMCVAWYLAEHVLPPTHKSKLIALALLGLPTLLIAKQPDLGTSILIASSGVFVLYLSGLSWRLILGASSLAAAAIYPMFKYVLHPYQQKRVLTFLSPESDPLGSGWNIIQSKTAIGSGGFYGKGWLNGTQSQLDFLPESHTDFIIAVIAEELGFIGVLFLMLLYSMILGRCLYISIQAQDTFSRLLAGSITLTFFVYIFVNIGMVSGLLPVVGVPLPLISYGGTSIVTLMAGFGILMSIHTHRKFLGIQ